MSTKFKVGDRVKSLFWSTKGEEGIIISESKKSQGCWVIKGFSQGSEPEGDGIPYAEYNLELIEETLLTKTNNIMSKVKDFVKNLALSADEKLLRKHGFKDSCGDYTDEAKSFAINKLCAEKEADMVAVAKEMEADLYVLK